LGQPGRQSCGRLCFVRQPYALVGAHNEADLYYMKPARIRLARSRPRTRGARRCRRGCPIISMILTQCTACAAPLGLASGKKCSRCSTRYCGPACQAQHWKEGGHDKLCKKIKRSGGAEQYHADKEYAESVVVAVKKCAVDTKDQTCYICTDALHWKTKEGLVRGCSCRGTAGFAHVSCLAEQAKILCAEAEENNLDLKMKNGRWARWYSCSLCEQAYHGTVKCALGWACWKMYLGRPETNQTRYLAMGVLGNGLAAAQRHVDALAVREAELSMKRRIGAPATSILKALSNLAGMYHALERKEDALRTIRDVYSGSLEIYGEDGHETIQSANNYATSLLHLKQLEEAKSVLRKTIPVAQRVLGECHISTLTSRLQYARALYWTTGATLDGFREAVTMLEETERTARRVLGHTHPLSEVIEKSLGESRAVLSAAARRKT